MADYSPRRDLANAAPRITPAQQGDPEWTSSNTMNRHIAQARREMGPKRWAELNGEWL